MSEETNIEDRAAVRKKCLKFKILNLLRRYTIIKNKKNLKNNIDFVNLSRSTLLYPSKYMVFATLRLVEKKTKRKNKKIIFIKKSYL